MIDLTTRLCNFSTFADDWKNIVDWLVDNVGKAKFEKLNVMQGEGWMIVRTIHDGDHFYQFKLLFDDPKLELMFRLAWS